ncbi:MAG: hypothetical protein CM15mP120_07220 [Pseudomonadota bacterium]|nr:MAG: hypothetical protein CM15mP120_07220 [Pseudomonadota bacterium]
MDVPVVGDIESLAGGQGPMLLENIRFFEGEKANDDVLAQRLANQCDVFVMDAFGTAHRAHASTHGIAKFASVACAGLLLEAELAALQDALASPAKPMLAIVGGAKVSTKLEVLNSLATIADQLLVGGGIANTFIAAAGYGVGKSLHEPDLIDTAREIAQRVTIPLPEDVMVATDFDAAAVAQVRSIDQVGADEMILDIGPATLGLGLSSSYRLRRFYGMAQLACSSLISLERAPGYWPRQLHKALGFPSPVVAIR